MEDIYRRIGSSVRARRQARGWTQEELGESSGLHPSYVGQIERGAKKVSLKTLHQLAQALGASMGELLDEPPPRYQPSWTDKIGSLLRDKSSHQKAILYSTLKHLSRQLEGRR